MSSASVSPESGVKLNNSVSVISQAGPSFLQDVSPLEGDINNEGIKIIQENGKITETRTQDPGVIDHSVIPGDELSNQQSLDKTDDVVKTREPLSSGAFKAIQGEQQNTIDEEEETPPSSGIVSPEIEEDESKNGVDLAELAQALEDLKGKQEEESQALNVPAENLANSNLAEVNVNNGEGENLEVVHPERQEEQVEALNVPVLENQPPAIENQEDQPPAPGPEGQRLDAAPAAPAGPVILVEAEGGDGADDIDGADGDADDVDGAAGNNAAGGAGGVAAPGPITNAEVQAIQTRVAAEQQNIAEKSTVEVLQNALTGLEPMKNRVPGGNGQLNVKSHLEKNPDGSYKIETYPMQGSDEIRYKIKATYTITLQDAQGRVVNDNGVPPKPIQVKVERDIYIKTFVKPEDVPFLASKYKDTLVQLAGKNSGDRLEQYDVNNNDALIKQRDFTFSLSKDPQTGLKALSSISTTIPAVPGGAAARPIELKLGAKALKPNTLYVRNLLDTTAGKRKIKRKENVDVHAARFVSGKQVYKTKEEALQHAEYTIEDPQVYARFVEKDLGVHLIQLEDEVQKKQEELKELETAFKKSRYLGLGSKNTPAYEKFLKETFSQKEPDNLKWEKETTDYLELKDRRDEIKVWKRDKEAGLKSDIAAIRGVPLPGEQAAPPISQALQGKIAGLEVGMKEQLEILKAVKRDLTPPQIAKIDDLIRQPNNQDIINELNNNNVDPQVKADIQAALRDQMARIKTYKMLQNLEKEHTDGINKERQLEADESTYQTERDAFNSKLIRLEKGQKDLSALVSRFEALKTGMDNEQDLAKTQLMAKDITPQKIAELKKQAKHYDELIAKLHKEFIEAGAMEELPAAVPQVVIGDQ